MAAHAPPTHQGLQTIWWLFCMKIIFVFVLLFVFSFDICICLCPTHQGLQTIWWFFAWTLFVVFVFDYICIFVFVCVPPTQVCKQYDKEECFLHEQALLHLYLYSHFNCSILYVHDLFCISVFHPPHFLTAVQLIVELKSKRPYFPPKCQATGMPLDCMYYITL